MLNPIASIKKTYQLNNDLAAQGIDRDIIEQHEKALGIQLPAPLYHYLLALGGNQAINASYHQFVQLPFEKLGEHLVIGKTCDNDAVWGVHFDDLIQHNPMVKMSRNFDAIKPSEVHWFDELPLAEFLLAQAIVNGVNKGLDHHVQIYDFEGDCILTHLIEKLTSLATEITELQQTHERYFQTDDFEVVMMVSLDDNQPTAFMIGTQTAEKFYYYKHILAIGFDNNP